MHIVAWCGVYMQLFRARKLLHSALTGYESGEVRSGEEGVKDTSLKRNLIKISTGLDQHSAQAHPTLHLSNSYFAKLFANSFPRKIVQQLGMNPVLRGHKFRNSKMYICSLDRLD